MKAKIKKFIKRANRGLILTALVVIGLIIYVAVDEKNFKKNIPELEDFISDYLDSMADIAVLPEKDWNTENLTLTKEGLEALSSNYNNLINSYWTEYEGSSGYNYIYKKRNVLDMSENISTSSGYLTSWDYRITNIQVKKTSPVTALIGFDFEASADFYGTAPALFSASYIYVDNYLYGDYRHYDKIYDMDSGDEGNNSEVKALRHAKIYGHGVEYKVIKINGEWKIYGVQDNSTGISVSD